MKPLYRHNDEADFKAFLAGLHTAPVWKQPATPKRKPEPKRLRKPRSKSRKP